MAQGKVATIDRLIVDWTKSFHGLQHLETKYFLCTVADRGDFTEVTVKLRQRSGWISFAFQNFWDMPDHVQAAKAWCEEFIHLSR